MAKNQVRIQRWENKTPLTQEEAEAHLHREGYRCFCWHDVAGSQYPKHRHDMDECLWIIRGEIHFYIEDEVHMLMAGDRIYLPAHTLHKARVPESDGVTYLVGQRKPV